MEALNDYFVFVVFLGLAVGAVSSLLHEGAREISLGAIGVVTLVALLSPLSSLIGELGALPDVGYDEDLPASALDEAMESAFSEGVGSYVSSEWGIPRDDVHVEASGFSREEMCASELYVTLGVGGALADIRSMREELCDLFLLPDGKCQVVIRLE